MKRAGDLCKLDKLGRIVIPVRLRKQFDLKPEDTLEIFTDDKSIILQRYIPSCFLCGNDDSLKNIKDKYICKDCISEIASTAE